MKKQILFMMFLSLAFVFAGVNDAFGQANPPTGDGLPADYEDYPSTATAISCAAVTDLTCASTYDELHPQVGQDYDYSVTTAAANKVHWFVVANDNNIITAINDITGVTGTMDDIGDGSGTYIANSDGAYNNKATTSHTVNITWKAFDGLTNVVLLVAYVEDETGCTDNIEVYRILPIFKFTLDVNAIASSGAEVGVAGSSTALECVSPIHSATYTPAADPLNDHGELIMDYGINYVFFTVTAANFTHSWQPTFDIDYTGTYGGTITAVDYATPTNAMANTGWVNVASFDGTTPATEVLHSGTVIGTSIGVDDGSGECIVVRVEITHGDQAENAVDDQTVTFAVNGFMYDRGLDSYTTASMEDIHYTDTDADADALCNDTDGFENDWVNYVLTPRPQIISNTGTTPQEFETKDDNSDNLGNN